jgi:histidinol-phosphate/aromatic aminotransferase/cobyric acid decarboxylase-like protein
VADALAKRGILVQAFGGPVLASYVRIAVGRREQNDRLVEALASLAPRLEGESA